VVAGAPLARVVGQSTRKDQRMRYDESHQAARAAPPATPEPVPPKPSPPPPDVVPPEPPQPEPPPPEIDDPQPLEDPVPVREPPGMPPPMAVRSRRLAYEVLLARDLRRSTPAGAAHRYRA
jgi:hypothetical protein